MDFHIDMNASRIQDQGHLNNLHKHITRTAKKYDPIKSKVFVNILKSDVENLVYNPNLIHIVIQAESLYFDDMEMTQELFDKRELIERTVCEFIGEHLVEECEGIKESTVVSGAQPNGSFIAPCIHIIYEVENEAGQPDSSYIPATLKFLDSVISSVMSPV